MLQAAGAGAAPPGAAQGGAAARDRGGWARRGSRGAGHLSVSLVPVRLQALVRCPRSARTSLPPLETFGVSDRAGRKHALKKKKKSKIEITWTNRALQKVLDVDPVSNRQTGTQTNPTCDKDKLFLLRL